MQQNVLCVSMEGRLWMRIDWRMLCLGEANAVRLHGNTSNVSARSFVRSGTCLDYCPWKEEGSRAKQKKSCWTLAKDALTLGELFSALD